MSSMLEQAIVDAQALREAALKNAEQSVIEKYAPEIKAAVESLLEGKETLNEEVADKASASGGQFDIPYASDPSRARSKPWFGGAYSISHRSNAGCRTGDYDGLRKAYLRLCHLYCLYYCNFFCRLGALFWREGYDFDINFRHLTRRRLWCS